MARTKITVKSPDFGKWQKAVNDLRVKTGFSIVENAVNNAPTNTGNYKSQIEFDGSNTVIAQANYSAAIEYGTEPHIIEPNERQALAFQSNGQNVVVKKVHHPGTKPNPVMRNAAAKVQKEIPQLWEQVQKENGL